MSYDFTQEEKKPLITEGDYEVVLQLAEKRETLTGKVYINCQFKIRNDVNQPFAGAYVYDAIWEDKTREGTFDFNKLKAIVKTQPDAKLTFASDDEIIQFINGLLMKVHILKKPADSYHTEEYNEIKYCSYKPTSAPLKTIGEANGVSSVSVPSNIEINDEDLPF